MNNLGKFLVALVISFFCMIGALATKGMISIFLMGLAMLCWYLFIKFSASRESRMRNKEQKLFNEAMKWRTKMRDQQ